MAEGIVIETIDLKKRYKEVNALNGLNLSVPVGSIYGLLGRSGAGKTTAIKILLGMTRATAGSARVFGEAVNAPAASVAIRLRSGYLNDGRDLYGSMSVAEIIAFTASFFPNWRSDLARQYLRSFDLAPSRAVRALPPLARTKLAMLLAFCRGAQLLLVDEVTSGLDAPGSVEVLQALITHVATEGATVLFASHQVAEIEQIADHVSIIDQGRSMAQGALDDVRELYRRIELVFDSSAPAAPMKSAGIMRIERSGRVLTVFAQGDAASIMEEAGALGSVSAESRPLTLKEIYLELVVRQH